MDKFYVCVSMSSFTERGMEIHARGETCKGLFSVNVLTIISNYSCILFNRYREEHLFGPMPIPRVEPQLLTGDQELAVNPDDWYFLIYIFNVRNPSITDSRVIQQQNVTIGFFLIFYPRIYDETVMHFKKDLVGILKKASGLIVDIKTFNDSNLSIIEKEIQSCVLNNYHCNEENVFAVIEKTQQTPEFQRNQLLERSMALTTLANNIFDPKDKKSPKKTVKLIIILPEIDILPMLQLYVPPFNDLEQGSWSIIQNQPHSIEFYIEKLTICFNSYTVFQSAVENFYRDSTPIKGIYLAFHGDNYKLDAGRIAECMKKGQKIIISSYESNIISNFPSVQNPDLQWMSYPIKEISDKTTAYHQLIWFYTMFIDELTIILSKKRQQEFTEGSAISENARRDISALFSKSLED